MARPRNHAHHVSVAVEDLIRSVTRLVDSVATATTATKDAFARGKRIVADGRTIVSDAKRAKLRKKLKAYWAKLKGAARADRVRKMRAGRRARSTS